jgi:hypothetical protein
MKTLVAVGVADCDSEYPKVKKGEDVFFCVSCGSATPIKDLDESGRCTECCSQPIDNGIISIFKQLIGTMNIHSKKAMEIDVPKENPYERDPVRQRIEEKAYEEGFAEGVRTALDIVGERTKVDWSDESR